MRVLFTITIIFLVIWPFSSHAVERSSGWSVGINTIPGSNLNYRRVMSTSTIWSVSLDFYKWNDSIYYSPGNSTVPIDSTYAGLTLGTAIRRYGHGNLSHLYSEYTVGVAFRRVKSDNANNNIEFYDQTRNSRNLILRVGVGGEYSITNSLFLEAGFGIYYGTSIDRYNIDYVTSSDSISEQSNYWRLGSFTTGLNLVYYF